MDRIERHHLNISGFFFRSILGKPSIQLSGTLFDHVLSLCRYLWKVKQISLPKHHLSLTNTLVCAIAGGKNQAPAVSTISSSQLFPYVSLHWCRTIGDSTGSVMIGCHESCIDPATSPGQASRQCSSRARRHPCPQPTSHALQTLY